MLASCIKEFAMINKYLFSAGSFYNSNKVDLAYCKENVEETINKKNEL